MWGWIKRTAKRVWRGVRGTVRFLSNFFTTIFFRLIKLPELILTGIFGIRWRKYMEVTVLILQQNGKPLLTAAGAQAAVEEARRVFRSEANIRLRKPHYLEEIVNEFVDEPTPEYVLNPKCGTGAFKHTFTRVGGWFSSHSAAEGATMFVVADVQGKNGCHLGIWADWGYIEPGQFALTPGSTLLTLAHELGHACQLLDRDNVTSPTMPGQEHNLMWYEDDPPGNRTAHLTRWQRAWMRTSRRVHYFG